jgi:hypothetical protein
MSKSKLQPSHAASGELKALKRAAKAALELARQTGTPCYVEKDGKIVDLAARPAAKRRRESRANGKKKPQ